METEKQTNGQGTTQEPVRGEMEKMALQFKAALPTHIPVERFVRIVLTSVNSNPDLLRVAATVEGRRSLFESATKAAQDGLLPDGRDGAFVVYNTNLAKRGQQPRYVELIRWMPMVGGICKKVRNSGEVTMIDAQVVHEKDEYESWTDENGPHFKYRKARGERGKPILTFAYANTKDGGHFLEELDESEIQAIRNISKAKDSGPWSGPFSNEMRRKSGLRRLMKYRLPSSADIDEVIRRDDDLYDLNQLGEGAELPKVEMPKRLSESKPDGGETDGKQAENEPGPTQAQRLEAWITASTDEDFLAVTALEFAKDCAGLKGGELERVTKMYNDRRGPLVKKGK